MLLPEIGKNSFVSLEISASTTTGCDNVVTHWKNSNFSYYHSACMCTIKFKKDLVDPLQPKGQVSNLLTFLSLSFAPR